MRVGRVGRLQGAVHQLVLLVAARLLAASQVEDLPHGGVLEELVVPGEGLVLLQAGAHRPGLVTEGVPLEPAAGLLGEALPDTSQEAVAGVLDAGVPVGVQGGGVLQRDSTKCVDYLHDHLNGLYVVTSNFAVFQQYLCLRRT